MKIKIIKWSQNIRAIPRVMQVEMIKNPIAIINAMSYKKIGKHLTGYSGEGTTYDNYEYFKLADEINQWEKPTAYEVDFKNICHPSQIKHAYNNGDFSALEYLFSPQVAVGDMLVIWSGSGVAYQPPIGYICGEGLKWQMVYLADDGEYFRNEKKQMPCVGKRYEKELYDCLIKKYNTIN